MLDPNNPDCRTFILESADDYDNRFPDVEFKEEVRAAQKEKRDLHFDVLLTTHETPIFFNAGSRTPHALVTASMNVYA